MFYSEEIVDEVREKNDIVDVISPYVRLTRRGSNYVGLCPFHNEKTPSFSVNAGRQTFHCFGCGVGGNAYSFVMKYENLTFPEAIKHLADRAGIKLPEEEDNPEARKRADLRTRLFEVYKEAAKFYYFQLRGEYGSHPMEYLKNRGLTDKTINDFGLGYSVKSPNALYNYLKSKGYSDKGRTCILQRGQGDI